MKTSRSPLAWVGLSLAILACVLSVAAFASTRIRLNHLDAQMQLISASSSTVGLSSEPVTTSDSDFIYHLPELTQGSLSIPQDLSRLGLDLTGCSERSLKKYLETDTFALLLAPEGCNHDYGRFWAYFPATNQLVRHKVRYAFGEPSSVSPDKRFQIVMGPANKEEEVRTLVIKDFINDTEKQTEPLPATLTYRAGISEYYGKPYGGFGWDDGNYTYAEVYDSKTPLDVMDARLPILKQFLSISRELK